MWVHIPPGLDTAYPCAPVAAASISASCSPSRISTPAALSNGRNTLDRPSSPASGPDTSPRPQSGTICAPSTPGHGLAASTPCLPDTPASLSAPLESASARTTSGTYGPRSQDAPASSAMASNGYSLKTSPGTSALALKPCCENFGTWASRLRLAYSQRAKLARRMKGSGSSSWPTESWPTPATRDHHAQGADHNPAAKSSSLATIVEKKSVWGTPRASDGENGGPNQSFGAGGTPLPAQAAQWQTPVADDQMDRLRGKINSRGEPKLSAQALQWPTPAAQNWKGSSEASITRADGKSRMDILHYRAEQGFTHPAPVTLPGGPLFSHHAPISRRLFRSAMSNVPQTTLRRWLRAGSWRKARLNPLFVEWLQAFPIGHALCGSWGTRSILWQRDMRGALLHLPMASAPWIWAPSDGAEPEISEQLNLFA